MKLFDMVAVKSLWTLWKNLSTSLSFANLSSTLSNKNNQDDDDTTDGYRYGTPTTKYVKYNNKLRRFRKSISSHFPQSLKSSSSFNSFNCMKKSNSCEPSGGRKGTVSGHNSANIGWNYALDDSDTEFEDDNDFVKELDAYHIRMTIEEISDLDDEDEALTCDVCDRSFPTIKRLAEHQLKKRHYGCLQCDSIFPTRPALEHHREQMNHFDYILPRSGYGSDTTTFESDDDENGIIDDEDDEEREQLLL